MPGSITSFERYWILESLHELIKKTEGDIKRTKERRKIDMLEQVKGLQTVSARVGNTPECK